MPRIIEPAQQPQPLQPLRHFAAAVAAAPAGDEDDEDEECVVCLDRPPQTKLKPCGCSKMCLECALQLAFGPAPRCPWCRRGIENVEELIDQAPRA